MDIAPACRRCWPCPCTPPWRRCRRGGRGCSRPAGTWPCRTPWRRTRRARRRPSGTPCTQSPGSAAPGSNFRARPIQRSRSKYTSMCNWDSNKKWINLDFGLPGLQHLPRRRAFLKDQYYVPKWTWDRGCARLFQKFSLLTICWWKLWKIWDKSKL